MVKTGEWWGNWVCVALGDVVCLAREGIGKKVLEKQELLTNY
jgi:hypothetical protein